MRLNQARNQAQNGDEIETALRFKLSGAEIKSSAESEETIAI